MKRLLFVVHRYAPFPGGSENHVRDMTEEALSRGNDVWVFSGEHQGDLNGVKVSSNPQILLENWDLIIVHGGGVAVQDFVLSNIKNIPSKVLFLLIKPSDIPIYKQASKECYKIGYCTLEDYDWIKKENLLHKAVRVVDGINIENSIAKHKISFREKYDIQTKLMIMSSGGFWPNKAHRELVEVFKKLGRDDMTLVITGYDDRYNILSTLHGYNNIRVMMVEDRDWVMDGVCAADLYIMHSHDEGFGLVLLESMLNETPWAARNIAGAKLMKDHGFTYDNDEDLLKYLKDFTPTSESQIKNNYDFVKNTHTIKNTIDDILGVA
jgi:glycosyltransferase involved in cell wall biosynthesis